MAAYIVVTAYIHDREAFMSGYARVATELTTRFGGEYVVRAPGIEVLEGDRAGGGSLVVSKWPDRAAALAFWESDAYAEAKKLREGIADCDVFLVVEP